MTETHFWSETKHKMIDGLPPLVDRMCHYSISQVSNLPLHTAQNEVQDTTTKNQCVKEGWERQKIERCAVLRGRTGDGMAVNGVVSGLRPVLGTGKHSQ